MLHSYIPPFCALCERFRYYYIDEDKKCEGFVFQYPQIQYFVEFIENTPSEIEVFEKYVCMLLFLRENPNTPLATMTDLDFDRYVSRCTLSQAMKSITETLEGQLEKLTLEEKKSSHKENNSQGVSKY